MTKAGGKVCGAEIWLFYRLIKEQRQSEAALKEGERILQNLPAAPVIPEAGREIMSRVGAGAGFAKPSGQGRITRAPAAAAIFCDYAEAEKMANIEIEYRQGRSNSLPDFAKPSCPAFQGIPTQTDNKGQIGFQF